MNERLNGIKQTVRTSIRHHTHRDFIGYGDCNDICCDMQTCLDSVRDEQSNPVLVFDVALFMLITGTKLASTADSSSGYLSAVIDHALALLREVIEAISITQDVTIQSKCYASWSRNLAIKPSTGGRSGVMSSSNAPSRWRPRTTFRRLMKRWNIVRRMKENAAADTPNQGNW